MSTTTSGPAAGRAMLPAGFAHPHASEQARAIAEQGMILRVQAGSGVHIIYSALKRARLALAGNPTGLLALFAPDSEVVFRDADQPDRRWVDDWLHRSYLDFWARGQ